MVLKDIITDLQFGELNSHGMFFTQLSSNNRERLVNSINMGLLALYTRFPLLTKELTLMQFSFITDYHLTIDHAKTYSGSSSIKYIIDSEEYPFLGDVIRVESVYDEIGDQLLLNNTTECKVALTPAMDTIEIPNPTDTNCLFVIYRAKHPSVKEDYDTILLPEHFKPALLAYVAHRIYSSSTAQDQIALASAMMQKFEVLCTQFVEVGVANRDDGEFNCQFNKGGWV